MQANKLVDLSQAFLKAVKLKEPYNEIRQELVSLNPAQIATDLKGETDKKAFWLNMYNAFIQILLKENPGLYQNLGQFFSKKLIMIAHQKISFDDIEHGILRQSQYKYGFGYIKSWFSGSFIKESQVKHRDYRVHFALNCGAKSCPPILFYKSESIDNQLDIASKNYLEQTCEYNPISRVVLVPKLMLWFHGDFDGRQGIIQLLKKHQIIPANTQPKIKYQVYDWGLALDKFA
jgi:hypothetical protein